MPTKNRYWFVIVLVISALLLVFTWPVLSSLDESPHVSSASAQQGCTTLVDPKEIPAPALIDFDDLPNGQVIDTSYQTSHGVTFGETDTTEVIISNKISGPQSMPNVAINNDLTRNGGPIVIRFDKPRTHVGFWIGNGERINANLFAYDANGSIICELFEIAVPGPLSKFIGLADPEGRIAKIDLDYLDPAFSETIDDLYFSPKPGASPTRTPLPTWTPVPSPKPTLGPDPTPTPLVPMYAYKPPAVVVSQPLVVLPDLSIHGIEITQGIQCFDTSKGDPTCTNNSLPMVAQKDSTARIYLKYSALTGSSMNNVPVRLFIQANGIWYQANATGKATTTLNQANSDSANVYFNVNFSNDVQVDFYAFVDPDGVISEFDETNNRFPAAEDTYITL